MKKIFKSQCFLIHTQLKLFIKHAEAHSQPYQISIMECFWNYLTANFFSKTLHLIYKYASEYPSEYAFNTGSSPSIPVANLETGINWPETSVLTYFCNKSGSSKSEFMKIIIPYYYNSYLPLTSLVLEKFLEPGITLFSKLNLPHSYFSYLILSISRLFNK